MKFIQIGDTHLGYRQYGLKARERDFRIAFGKAMEIVLDKRPDLVVFTGDTFEGNKPDPRDLNYVRDWLEELKAKKIKAVGIEGNHDAANGEILKNLGIDSFEEGECLQYGGINFYGISYTPKAHTFKELLETVPANTDVLIIHQTLMEVADIYGDVSADDIVAACPNVRYVAMGHIHDHAVFSRGNARLVYNGSTEMNDIDESREKCIPHVEILDDDKAPSVTLLSTEARPLEKLVLAEEKHVEELFRDLAKYENHLLYIVCKNTLTRQLSSVLEEADKHGIMHTVTPVTDTSKVDVKKIQSWERSRSAVDLKKIIEEDFEGLDRERSLVMALLDTPGNAKEILEEYVDEQLESSD